MRWALVVVVALAAVIAANAALLSYGSDRHDPVGRLSPVAALSTTTAPAAGRPRPAPTHTPRSASEREDD